MWMIAYTSVYGPPSSTLVDSPTLHRVRDGLLSGTDGYVQNVMDGRGILNYLTLSVHGHQTNVFHHVNSRLNVISKTRSGCHIVPLCCFLLRRVMFSYLVLCISRLHPYRLLHT